MGIKCMYQLDENLNEENIYGTFRHASTVWGYDIILPIGQTKRLFVIHDYNDFRPGKHYLSESQRTEPMSDRDGDRYGGKYAFDITRIADTEIEIKTIRMW
jgi:hypothetical protein